MNLEGGQVASSSTVQTQEWSLVTCKKPRTFVRLLSRRGMDQDTDRKWPNKGWRPRASQGGNFNIFACLLEDDSLHMGVEVGHTLTTMAQMVSKHKC